MFRNIALITIVYSPVHISNIIILLLCRSPASWCGGRPDPGPELAHGDLRGCDGGGHPHGRGHGSSGQWPQAEDWICQHGVTLSR